MCNRLLNEKRLYTRINKRIDLSVYYVDQLISYCHTLNFSIGGAFVLSKEIGFMENSFISVEFDVNHWHPLYDMRLPSVILRCNEHGFAISFEILVKDIEDLMTS